MYRVLETRRHKRRCERERAREERLRAGGVQSGPRLTPTCVRPPVYIEAGLLREALQADVALIRPLACVRAGSMSAWHCARCTHKSE
ncbi:unnamed protein product [Leptidea sinapis]|uniref:Uncharacterized protein n=1 Tax=Leptidea sinapis TaxID=189913 RepID=A0A5E4QVD3_9NEOP|nr:unnamed protein product [Leptidea sinapis]